MKTSTVVSRKSTGGETLKYWDITEYMADNESLWCLIKDGRREYTILHRKTGLALPHLHKTQKIAKQRLKFIMAGVVRYKINTDDAAKVVDAIGSKNKREYDKWCKLTDPLNQRVSDTINRYAEVCEEVKEHFGLDDDMEATVTITNVHDKSTREYTVTQDDVIDGNHCCGPCECHIEPDGVCRNGWPGTEDALARC
jgi:hypothetical protein